MMYYLDFIREEFDPLEMEGPLPSSPFYGKNVVVTGVMTKWSREEIEEQLRKIGARVRTTVSTKTDFVLAGDHSGTKRVRAAELGIPILYEDEFIQMLGELEI
jgi:DNA ligase (NAD+)